MFGNLVRRKPKPAPTPQSSLAHMPSGSDLSDRELILLSAASQSPDGILPDSDANDDRAEAARSDIDHLEALGFIARDAVEQTDDDDRGDVRGARSRYRVTPAGLEAIGLDHGASGATSKALGGADDDRVGTSSTTVSGSTVDVAGVNDALLPVQQPVLSTEVEIVRTAKAPKRGKLRSKGLSPERQITTDRRAAKAKSIPDRVLALLMSPDGVRMAQIVSETGWQAHSLRAVLSRLRADGHAIDLQRGVDGRGGVYRLRSAGETSVGPVDPSVEVC